MRRLRRRWLRLPPIVFASLVLCAAATAGNVRIAGVDLGAYPEVRVTVVAPPGSAQPRLRENGVAVSGLRILVRVTVDVANIGRVRRIRGSTGNFWAGS